MRKIAVTMFAGVALALAGCSHDLSQAEVNQMLLEPSRGLLGGFDVGDSWEKIKAEHDKRYTVRDETMTIGSGQSTFRQLRRDLTSPGEEGFYLTFQVDAQGKVTSVSASVYGHHGNAVVIRKFLDDVIAHFDKKVGNGHCSRTGTKDNSSSCNWEKPGGESVNVLYMEFSDPLGGQVEINVTPSRK